MGERKIRIHAESMIEASAQVIYEIIADYHSAHPEIVPKPYFQGIRVESGGVGAGTVISVTIRVLGRTSVLRQRVSEPEPGRALVESNLDGTLETTFIVTPVSGAKDRKANVSITTVMKTHPGIRGIFEQRLIPRILHPAYQKELKLLQVVARKRTTAADPARPAG